MVPSILEKLSSFTQRTNKPLVYVESVGFLSRISVALPPSFPVVETHPDPASTSDLRLLNPWPELSALAREMTAALDTLTDHDHGHVPYLVLLLHYLDQWRQAHDGKPPQNYKEKTEFRELVRAGARTNNTEGGEENYDEAVAAVLKSLNPPSLPSSVRDVFESDECKSLTETSASFWLIASAISTFFKSHTALPLPGAVPDMKAQSVDYIRLQNIYKAKARVDFTEVLATVRGLESRLERRVAIDEKDVEAFCKGASSVKLLRGAPLQSCHTDGGSQWSMPDRAKRACKSSIYHLFQAS